MHSSYYLEICMKNLLIKLFRNEEDLLLKTVVTVTLLHLLIFLFFFYLFIFAVVHKLWLWEYHKSYFFSYSKDIFLIINYKNITYSSFCDKFRTGNYQRGAYVTIILIKVSKNEKRSLCSCSMFNPLKS